MAILDNLLTFSNAQAVTATAASTNVVDLGVDRDIGVGEPVFFAVQVGAAFAGLTSLTVALQTSADNSTWTTLYQSAAIPVASLTAGAQPVRVVVPSSTKQYLRVNYTVAGTGTAGNVTASLLLGPDGYRAYPPGSPVPDFSAVTDIAVTGVSLTPATASVVVGSTVTLTAAISPTGASDTSITATSSDATKATVSVSGDVVTVTGVAAGSATITVTTNDGSFTDTSAVTVTAS